VQDATPIEITGWCRIADAWQFWDKNETYISYFLRNSYSKNIPAPLPYAVFE